jgi:hypothetical protein
MYLKKAGLPKIWFTGHGCQGLFGNDRNLQNRLPIFALYLSKLVQKHTTRYWLCLRLFVPKVF